MSKFQCKQSSKLVIIAIFVLIFLLRLLTQPRLQLRNDQTIRVTGTLAEEPKLSDKSQIFNLGQIKIVTQRYPEYHYGDQLQAEGKVKVITRFKFFNLFNFDDTLMFYPVVDSVRASRATPWRHEQGVGWIINLRNNLLDFYQKSLPSPYDGIVSGIVLGDKSLLTGSFWEKLKQTGTLHIMVASGMNIAFFAEVALSAFCILVKRRYAVILLYLTIWFYTILTGMSAPVIRAAIMASLIYFSQLTGRPANTGRILWLTGGVMLIISPKLLFDIGFQLSFLATAGLVYLQPAIEKGKKYFFLFKFKNFSSSIAAQLMTLPILVGSFGSLNLISPITNLLVLWLIPLILLGGSLFGLIGLFVPYIGNILVLSLFPLLFYLEQTINLFAKMTVFQVQIPSLLIPVVVVVIASFWILVIRNGFGRTRI